MSKIVYIQLDIYFHRVEALVSIVTVSEPSPAIVSFSTTPLAGVISQLSATKFICGSIVGQSINHI